MFSLYRGPVDIARSLLFMTHVALILQDTQQRADGRVARRLWHRLADLCHGGASGPVENIENLPFATADIGGWRFSILYGLRVPSIPPIFTFIARPELSSVNTMDKPFIMKKELALAA